MRRPNTSTFSTTATSLEVNARRRSATLSSDVSELNNELRDAARRLCPPTTSTNIDWSTIRLRALERARAAESADGGVRPEEDRVEQTTSCALEPQACVASSSVLFQNTTVMKESHNVPERKMPHPQPNVHRIVHSARNVTAHGARTRWTPSAAVGSTRQAPGHTVTLANDEQPNAETPTTTTTLVGENEFPRGKADASGVEQASSSADHHDNRKTSPVRAMTTLPKRNIPVRPFGSAQTQAHRRQLEFAEQQRIHLQKLLERGSKDVDEGETDMHTCCPKCTVPAGHRMSPQRTTAAASNSSRATSPEIRRPTNHEGANLIIRAASWQVILQLVLYQGHLREECGIRVGLLKSKVMDHNSVVCDE